MFNDISLRSKLYILSVVSLLGMVGLGVWGAYSQRASVYEDRKQMIQSLVEAARSELAQYEAQEQAGTLSREQAQAAARESLRGVRYKEREYFFIYTSEGKNVLLPPKPEREGTLMIDLKDPTGFPLIRELVRVGSSGGGFVAYQFPKAGSDEPLPKISYVAGVPDWNWVIGTGLYIDDIEAEFRSDLLINMAIVGVVALAVFGLVVVIGRSVFQQVGGEPRDAVRIMREVAAGRLSVQMGEAPAGSVLGELKALVAMLSGSVGEIVDGARRIGVAVQGIGETSDQVAEAAGSQSEATQTMAAAMEELTVSIQHISDNAQQTSRTAADSARIAGDSRQLVESSIADVGKLSATVEDASQRIATLRERADQVSSIAGTIKEIAAQTNLLALNAAIEAARAGEQGRGFAVVADEVRQLAERTASATVEIEHTVVAIQEDTHSAVKAMESARPQVERSQSSSNQVAEALRSIVDSADQAAVLVQDVANATREQGDASTSLAQQVERIAGMVEKTTEGMRVTADATRELDRVAEALNSSVSRFRC